MAHWEANAPLPEALVDKEVQSMKRLLLVSVLALTAGSLALPAWAQLGPADDRAPSAPPSTQTETEGERPPGAPSSGQPRPEDDERGAVRPPVAETQLCASYFRSLDKNADGVLTRNELNRFETVVGAVDTSRDGKISASEYQTACTRGILRDKDIKS
jgi:hypothetical protein